MLQTPVSLEFLKKWSDRFTVHSKSFAFNFVLVYNTWKVGEIDDLDVDGDDDDEDDGSESGGSNDGEQADILDQEDINQVKSSFLIS